jgi:hypothetical protein
MRKFTAGAIALAFASMATSGAANADRRFFFAPHSSFHEFHRPFFIERRFFDRDRRFFFNRPFEGFFAYPYGDPYYANPYYYPPYYYPPYASAASPLPPQVWYYCGLPRGYYPYVQSCSGPWQLVPATPPAAPGGTQY